MTATLAPTQVGIADGAVLRITSGTPASPVEFNEATTRTNSSTSLDIDTDHNIRRPLRSPCAARHHTVAEGVEALATGSAGEVDLRIVS